jgi:hypothetical protein
MLWVGIDVLEPDDPAAVAEHAKPRDHPPVEERTEPRAEPLRLHLAHRQQPDPVEPFPALRLPVGMHGFLQLQGSLPVSVAVQLAELGDLVRPRWRRSRGGGENRAAVGLQARRRQFCPVPGRTPSRRRWSSGVPTISSSRRICWLSVGWAMNICSAACVNVPASATATK